MADINSIVLRLESVSLGLDALERLGDLATEVRSTQLGLECVGAPLSFLSGALQHQVNELIVELKAARLGVVNG